MPCDQFTKAALADLFGVNAVNALASACYDVGARRIRVHEIKRVAGTRETFQRQLVRVWVAVGCPENGDPLIEIEDRPAKALDLGAGETTAVRRFCGSEISPELRYGSFLGETTEWRVEAAKDTIAADAGAEEVLVAFRPDEHPMPGIVMGGGGDIVAVDK